MSEHVKSLTWLGHNCFLFEYNNIKFLIDPFLTEDNNLTYQSNITADYLLISHGHLDHCKHALSIAKRSSGTIVGIAEVAEFFSKQGVATEGINIGGAIYLQVSKNDDDPKAQILAVQAPHSSTMPNGTPGGNSIGFVLSFSQNKKGLTPDQASVKPMKTILSDANAFSIYFACDTGYFSEMSWIGELGIDIAVIPIGDRYTMGPSLSLDAISAIKPRFVVPSHYNTWSSLKQNVLQWVEGVKRYTDSEPLILTHGNRIVAGETNNWK